MAEKTKTRTPWTDQAMPTRDQLVRVSVKGGAKDGYRCAGHAFTVAGQDFQPDVFTQEQLWKLSRNPFIAMYFVAAPKADAAKT